MVKRQRTWKRKAKAERKSLKMWADGAREDLLRPHIEPYTDALERGWRSERDYLQKVCNQYHTQISWRLADHEEPALPLAPYDPFAPPVAETLTEEEESARHARHKELNQRIRRWLKYRARSLRNKGLSKSALHDSPYAVLLAKLSGVTSPPKARQAFQQLMRERKAEVAAEVDKKWRAESINADGSANTKVPNAPYRCQVARDMFAALPAEEQAAIRARAVAEAQQAKLDYATAMKGGASKSPEARQKCIDGFGRFMAPLMRGLQEYTGLQGFLVMGGPMPKYNGAIQTIHLSVGTNLSAVPATFAGWDKARWNRNVTEYYMEFLRTAYSESGRRKAATGDSPTEESGAMDVDDPAAAAGASIGNDGDQDVRMDTADTANAAAGVPTPQMDSEATNGGGLTAPATGAPRPRPRFAGGKKKGIDEREGVAATGGSSNNERDDGGDDAHVSSPSTEKTSSPGGSSNDERGDAPVPSNGASDNASGASQPSLPAMIRSPPRPTLSPATPSATLVAPAPPLATASAPTPSAPPTLVAPPPPLATLSPRPTPPATPSDSEEGQSIRAVCPPKSAPWFEHGFTEVSREDLGARYEELLKAYIDLERGYGFALGTKALKGPDRPSQVQKWIRDGRGRTQAVREIANVDAFEKQWWSWWSGLQPAWRGAWRGQTALPPPPENADWEGLAVPGQNGLLSVVATIYWWGCAEKEKGMSSRSAGWEEAVTDVIWVFRGLTRKGK
ncbi:hypothetical protein DFH06DRAFT_997880 [Mycena polygramma]|nr:hypothetical protein DFH06DRAFT_997880 [Mycena polygramma]